MLMQPVKSSSIAAVGYDAPTRVLRVKFKSGGLYDHRNVTPAQHQEMLSAKSIGAHYAKYHGRDGIKVRR